jgi:hypothetical protein
LLSFGVGENSEMEAKRCGPVVNRPLFFGKGKAPAGIAKESQLLESNNQVFSVIKHIPQNNN